MIASYVLIIGAMKSGTTTLFDLLAQHPQICPCHPKEPGFFAFEDRWAEGFEWYESLFDFDPAVHRFGLDGSTDYSKHPFCTGVPERLARSAPRRFKLIYIMRHPLRRIESHARHTQIARKEVGQCLSPRRDHSLDAGVSPVSLAASRYAHQLDQYRDFFEAGDILPITFEEFTADQPATLGRVLDFLSLNRFEASPLHSNRAGGKAVAPSFWKSLNELGPLARAAKAIVPRAVRHGLRDRLSRPRIAEGRFKLTSEEDGRILEGLAPDLRRLRDVYGVDAGRHWGIEL